MVDGNFERFCKESRSNGNTSLFEKIIIKIEKWQIERKRETIFLGKSTCAVLHLFIYGHRCRTQRRRLEKYLSNWIWWDGRPNDILTVRLLPENTSVQFTSLATTTEYMLLWCMCARLFIISLSYFRILHTGKGNIFSRKSLGAPNCNIEFKIKENAKHSITLCTTDSFACRIFETIE